MKLRCKIGSIGFVGDRDTVSRGEIFEASETQAKILIDAGYADEVAEQKKEPEAPKETFTPKKRKGRT